MKELVSAGFAYAGSMTNSVLFNCFLLVVWMGSRAKYKSATYLASFPFETAPVVFLGEGGGGVCFVAAGGCFGFFHNLALSLSLVARSTTKSLVFCT
jgi:hypothetical protein